MRVEAGRIEGDLEVADGLTLAGMVSGVVTVRDGGELRLAGRVSQTLTVEPGGVAVVVGSVSGDVTNEGGTLTIYGQVGGRLRHVAGLTRLHEKAVVAGGVEGAVERFSD
jgi:hypothetical protein